MADLDEQALARLARRSGLAVGLSCDFQVLAPDTQKDDDSWIDDAWDSAERHRRRQLVETSRREARVQLGRLRAFTELLSQEVQQGVAPPPAHAGSLVRTVASGFGPEGSTSSEHDAKSTISLIADWLEAQGVGAGRAAARWLRQEVTNG